VSWTLERLRGEELRPGRWRLEYRMSDPGGNRAELSVLVEGKEVERATLHYRERVFWFSGRDAWEFLRLVEFGLLGTRLATEEWRGVLAEASAGEEVS
jgi:hypothetical protein